MANPFFALKNNILIPLVLAGVGVLLIVYYLNIKESELGLSAELVSVVVAKADIPAYTKLDQTMVSFIKVPKKFTQPSALGELAQVDNRVNIIPMLKGEQILDTMLSGKGQAASLALKIQKGYRAVTVGVDKISSVGGLLKAGDKVDVLGTFELSRSDEKLEKRTFTILNNIPVLAIGKDMGHDTMVEEALKSKNQEELTERVSKLRSKVKKDHKEKETVTLLADPMQVQKIVLTQELGEVVLALCPAIKEDKRTAPGSVNGKDMLGIEDEINLPRPWGEIRGAERK